MIFITGYKLFGFIDVNAPVLIYNDRWYSLDPLFHSSSFWEGFTYQHGPHRMGFAYLLFSITSYLSDWNSRWDMFLQAAIYVVCALMALRLKFLIFQKMHWTDVLIPCIFITIQSAVSVTFNPYIHGLMPFFALALGLCYYIRPNILRVFAFSIIAAVGIFSGFVLFVSVCFIAIQTLVLIKTAQYQKLFIFLPLPIIAWLYLSLSQVHSMKPELTNDISYYLEYGTLLSCNFLLNGRSIFWPYILLACISVFTFLIISNVRSLWAHPMRVSAIFSLLIVPPLLFILANIISRADIGMANALTSRYIPVTMTLVFGVYLMLLKITNRYYLQGFLLVVFTSVILRFQFTPMPARTERIITLSKNIKDWEKCLLQGNTYNNCKSKTNLPLKHNGNKKSLQEKIDFLKANKLNIFKE
ncbi:hypothetical protein Oweho_2961 [Owenweeksia hongkongensis DSM 17368]|uniref:Glycosyltransferase RgtA/B/C/D-like domain-containing protein n=1 Tax=Owenweeksia hongkongensis (strain DSM 17368 / CIP 108786 / JCM 12287 / NRRL B-23963 / UST20020801) TaxID=926562 RepID=G8R1W8_OWEHD|nr:hypothetical protein [Owenweeksia hongkongensis]AEV33918.1 hypothetical protein Oweho_2961 [Owenweeksia hongkongensis DSM 17368]